jgi:hypothetical protein
MVTAARAAYVPAMGSDIVDRGLPGTIVRDFFDWREPVGNIVSNPPFAIAERFVAHALTIARQQVAMLLPVIWLQGDRRSRWLETTPLERVLLITPRPSMPPGVAIMAGQKPGSGTKDYAWFIWSRGYTGTATIGWLRRNT